MGKTRHWLRYSLPFILILVSLVSLSACDSGDSSTTASTFSTVITSTQTSAANVTVTLANFAFSPASLEIKVGDTVTWINKDEVTHTVTGDTAGIFDSGNLATNATFSYTFTSAGTFKYHCLPHPYMTGTVIVK